MSYADAGNWVREVLKKTEEQLTDDGLTKWFDSAYRRLMDKWSVLPAYDGIDPSDQAAVDETLGFLVAAKLRPFIPKSIPSTDIVRIQTARMNFEYADPKPSETQEQCWARYAAEALRTVSVISQLLKSRPAASFVQAAGPRRAQEARGINTRSLINPLFTILADEWDYERTHLTLVNWGWV